MDERKSLDLQATSIMTLLCLIWGFQQVVLKVAAPDVTPLMQIAVRSGLSAVLVWWTMMLLKEPCQMLGEHLKPGLVVGGLFAIEFLLIGEGLRFTTASHMVVLLYTAPIFVALGLHWRFPAERMNRLQWTGIAMAFIGIAITFLFRGQVATGISFEDMLFGDALALLAGFAWGATTVAVRCTSLARAPATLTLLYQLVGGFVGLIAAAWVLGQTRINMTPVAISALAFHTIVVSFASYLTWFWLLKKYLASRLGVFSFLTPLFGVLFGVWFLDEPLEASFLVGAVLVLGGVMLVSAHGWITQLLSGSSD